MKNILLTITLCLLTLLTKAQDASQEASVEKTIYGVQFGVLGVWVHNESRLTNRIALRSEIGLDASFWGGYNSNGFLLGTVITLEPRWYYNINKRKNKSKRIDGNSGNFISLKTSYHPDLVIASSNNIKLVSDLTIVPTWGIRRNIGKHFNYEAGFGVGYIHYFKDENVIIINGESDVAVNLHARIGYRF